VRHIITYTISVSQPNQGEFNPINLIAINFLKNHLKNKLSPLSHCWQHHFHSSCFSRKQNAVSLI